MQAGKMADESLYASNTTDMKNHLHIYLQGLSWHVHLYINLYLNCTKVFPGDVQKGILEFTMKGKKCGRNQVNNSTKKKKIPACVVFEVKCRFLKNSKMIF